MASGRTVIARPVTLTMGDVTALCTRLDNRANSVVAHNPYVAADMRTAAAVIRRMQMAFHNSDTLNLPPETAPPVMA